MILYYDIKFWYQHLIWKFDIIFGIIFLYHILISYFDIIFWYQILISYSDIRIWYHIMLSYSDTIAWVIPRLSLSPGPLGSPRGVWGAEPPSLGGSIPYPWRPLGAPGGLGGGAPQLIPLFKDMFPYILQWYLAILVRVMLV